MLQKLLKQEAVKLQLESEDKEELFEEMTELLVSLCPTLNRSEVLDSLLQRESKMPTSVAFGIAVPHAISFKIKEPICAVGISRQGIDYDSPDGKPIHLIFMFLFPGEDGAIHLNIMQHLAYIFRNPDFYKNIMEKTTSAQVIQAIVDAEDEL